MDPDHLPAGDELDWLVLHHALDWKQGQRAFGQAPYLVPAPGGRVGEPALWPVSTDWRAASRVVSALEARGLRVSVDPDPPQDGFLARLSGPRGQVEARGETPCLAFSRAALKGVIAALIVKR